MARKKSATGKTHVALVLDQSGSMQCIKTPAMQQANDILESVKKAPGESTLSLVTFATYSRVLFSDRSPEDCPQVYDYSCSGSTDLFGAIRLAAGTLDGLMAGSDAALVMAVTDGENNIFTTSQATFLGILREKQATDRWTFVFNLPPNYKAKFCRDFGVPGDNCREWEATEEGVKEGTQAILSGLGTYYQARSRGETKTCDFFTTDLSGVTTADLRKCQDVTGHFKAWTVQQETKVQPFVEYHTGKDYITGQAYYCLTKTEPKVQPDKQVLLMEKGKKTVWGGPEARALVGIPVDRDVRVDPGNHSNFDIYVQSRSHNRKLVRGTKVLVDVTQTKALAPTWQVPVTS